MAPVKLLIKNSDLSKKITKEEVLGEKIIKDNLIIYHYLSSHGKCILSYDKSNNFIVFQRKGKIDTKFIIKTESHSSFLYENGPLKTEIFLLGNKITRKDNLLSFNYSLYNSISDLKKSNNIINKIYISIEEIT